MASSMDISNNALRKLKNVLQHGVLLSLQEIALRSVAASFWIDALLSSKPKRLNWKNYEDKVKHKASKVLPSSLKEEMMYIVKPLGLSILRWLKYHEYNFDEMRKDENFTHLKHLQWTGKGSIDYIKTAKAIIELETFSVEMCFKLACLYCLEDNIHIIWEKLPEQSKKYFCKEIKGLGTHLERYWAYCLSGQEYNLNIAYTSKIPDPLSSIEFTFKQSAADGHKAAAEYFFHKVTGDEREFHLLKALHIVLSERDYIQWGRLKFSKKDLSVVVCYLLSQLKPEMQRIALTHRPCDILICFLDWPLKDLFVEVANVIWPFIYAERYALLLTMMHKRFVSSGYCPTLFREFFRCSPGDFKKTFVDLECEFGYFLPEFFTMQDSKTVKVIFENIDASDRVRLVFNERVFKLLCDFISTGKWHMVEVCLQEAKLSNEDRQRLEKKLLKFVATTDGEVSGKEMACKRKKACEPIGETYLKSSEESSDDEMLSRIKKLCCEKNANVLPE